jgi:hypothetical protein
LKKIKKNNNNLLIGDLYMFDAFQYDELIKTQNFEEHEEKKTHIIDKDNNSNNNNNNNNNSNESNENNINKNVFLRRPVVENLYDVFFNIRADEAEHASTMKILQKDSFLRSRGLKK